MSSFIGDIICKADSKCRVVVPASFRKVLASSLQPFFVLRKNVFENCIDMYPLEEWERMIAGLKLKLNSFDAGHVAFLREFYRGTQEVEMDANGRILLPRRMLEEAGIDKEMVLAGQGSLIQIWDVKVYESVAIQPGELGALAGKIFHGGGERTLD